MRVMDRYVLAACAPSVLLALGVSTFVLLMHRLLRLTDLVVDKGVPLTDVVGLVVLALPTLLPLLIPVSLLVGTALTVARLSGDGEVVAMRAAGISLAGSLRPVVVLAALGGVLTGVMSVWLQPRAAHAFKSAAYESLRNRIDLSAQAGTFVRLGPNVTAYAARVEQRTGILGDVFLELRRGDGPPRWVVARTGRAAQEGGALTLSLEQGELHQPGEQDATYQVIRFRSTSLRVPLPTAAWRADPEDGLTGDLLRAVRSGAASPQVRLELHHRFSLPVSCVILGTLGALLGLHHQRTGRAWGVTVAIGILLAHYFLLTAARALGTREAVAPELAAWGPTGVMALVALYAYARKSRERPLPWESALGAILARAHRRRAPEQWP